MTGNSIFVGGDFPPCPYPFNLAHYVLEKGLETPQKPALEILGRDRVETLSYDTLRQKVLRFGRALRDTGLAPGAIILLRIGHDPLFPIAFLGAIAAGLVPVPTSADLSRAEVLVIAGDLRPDLVLFGPGTTEFAIPGVASARATDLALQVTAEPITPVLGDPERLAYIIYTSGTSGRAMAVQHAHRAIWARRMMWRDWYDLREQDRVLHAGAFNWTYTLGTGLLDPWSVGATALIKAPGTANSELGSLIKKHEASIFAAAPGVYRQMLKQNFPKCPNLRHGLSAGEKMPATLRKAWREAAGVEVYEALGMSEISTFISERPGQTPNDNTQSRPQRGRHVAVLDGESHTPVPRKEPGVLAVDRRDPGLMLGYRNAPRETAERFVGRWFLTGDIVTMDERDVITYLGRVDDMMNAGGFRVSPLDVEAAFLGHPEIQEAAAFEAEIRSGVKVIALAYCAGAEIPPDDLAAWAKDRLAVYKCPRIYQRLDTLPKGANNKVRRAELRMAYKAAT